MSNHATLRRDALSIAESLPIGGVSRSICPVCRGGTTGESSFCVGREPDRVWWKCFRGSCSSYPGVTGGERLPQAEVNRRLDRLKPYQGWSGNLEGKDLDYFLDRFELSNPDMKLGLNYAYLIPYRNVWGQVRGHILRQPSWQGPPWAPRPVDETLPKTKVYPSSTEPVQGWYRAPDNHNVVLVEDSISAMKVAEAGLTAVALLGVGLNAEKVRDIARFGPRSVTFALDPDAQSQAAQLARKWGLYFERTRVVALECDPKDIPLDELRGELGI